ncbi:hypothetical protein NM688_g8292 [Phlebia brevispora]|uniref:Uncharacterized protein n=1 Tax=Phlebia brevispora TaxID=194682 RepID=A0ACC1RU15_9APHY|nr:hypothetical protein NM688_g8292 [Phlebia brevispora]
MSADHTSTSVVVEETVEYDTGVETERREQRQNRTTQSCLNCHTSKRKCDRKRPCQRCIQLGLTGLCVYEVDNPAAFVLLEDVVDIDKAAHEQESRTTG